MLQHSELVYVKKIKGKGRGVFARQKIRKGTIIEKVPKIIIPTDVVLTNRLNDYCYLHDRGTVSICLGYGSLYNHSFRPNAHFEFGPACTMIFRAIRDIGENEEICINYNGDPKDRSKVDFEVVE